MEVLNLASDRLRVAIITRSHMQRRCLREMLESNNVEVVDNEVLESVLPNSLDHGIADIILVDLDDKDDRDAELLEALIDQTTLPLLFNDASTTRIPTTISGRAWGKRLSQKLYDLAVQQDALEHHISEPESVLTEVPLEEVVEKPSIVVEETETAELTEVAEEPEIAGLPEVAEEPEIAGLLEVAEEPEIAGLPEVAEEPEIAELPEVAEAKAVNATDRFAELFPDINVDDEMIDSVAEELEQAEQGVISHQVIIGEAVPDTDEEPRAVWVLGASIGGPQAVKQFLAALPPDLPATFVLAQHIGGGFVSLLAEQLGRVSYLKIDNAKEGARLEENRLTIAPVERQLDFGDTGNIHLREITTRSIYSPSIDAVMESCVRRYGSKVNAVVFSGMGNDSVHGCRSIREVGGEVWTQNADTCVISSMTDAVRAQGLSTFSGTPSELAEKLINKMEEQES